MEYKKFHQNTFTFIFKKVKNEEREITLQHEIELLDPFVLPNQV